MPFNVRQWTACLSQNSRGTVRGWRGLACCGIGRRDGPEGNCEFAYLKRLALHPFRGLGSVGPCDTRGALPNLSKELI